MENEIKVLDKGFVRLVESMGNDLSIVQAARVSYGQGSKGDEADKKLIKYLLDNQHCSPFEMTQFKFHIKLPIFVMRQVVRHRISSTNEISGRYSEFEENEYYIPEKWRLQDKKNKQGSSEEFLDGTEKIHKERDESISELYKDMNDDAFWFYKLAIERGIAKEMARMILPTSYYTSFYWSINARSLMNFLQLRLDSHAQWEIQEYARAIYKFFKNVLPWTASFFEDDLKNRGIFPDVNT